MNITLEEANRFACSVLTAKGVGTEHADLIARLLVKADQYGVSTHGLARLTTYLDRVDAGVMELDPDPVVVRDRPAAALLDAKNGWGQVAATTAMELAMQKALTVGIGVVSVRNSNHFGVAGHYALMAAEANLVGLVMTNASPAMAPFNASEALLGTNPIAFSIPTASGAPIVLDMSSSQVARGKIRRAHLEGATSIPAGWANDKDGNPTTDPAAALAGLLAPVGGAKGTGLSLIIDLLSGVLSGTGRTGEVRNIGDTSGPSQTGHLVIALDPASFIEPDEFIRGVETTRERIHSLTPVQGDAVLLPGELEYGRAQQAADAGIRVPDDVWESLRGLAVRLRVDPLVPIG